MRTERARYGLLLMLSLVVVAFAGNAFAASDRENAISSQVEHRLMADNHFRNSNIKADTNWSGEVTLHGTVPSQSDKDRATEIARSVDGVRSVDNDLRVSKSASASKY